MLLLAPKQPQGAALFRRPSSPLGRSQRVCAQPPCGAQAQIRALTGGSLCFLVVPPSLPRHPVSFPKATVGFFIWNSVEHHHIFLLVWGLCQKYRSRTLSARREIRPRQQLCFSTYCFQTAPRCSRGLGCFRQRVEPTRASRRGRGKSSGWPGGSEVNEAVHLGAKEQEEKKGCTSESMVSLVLTSHSPGGECFENGNINYAPDTNSDHLSARKPSPFTMWLFRQRYLI